MEITLYSFSKRSNSTKQPSNGTSFTNINLKEGTDFYNPTFELAKNPFSYNYVKWNSYYYYITEKTYVRYGIYQISCKLDVLATFKSQILNTSAYVIYSTNNYNDGIIDTRLSAIDNVSITSSSTSPFPSSDAYIVSLISPNHSICMVTSKTEVMNLVNSISNTDLLYNFLYETTDYLSKMFNSVSDCIRGVFYTPLRPSIIAPSGTTILLGKDYSTGVIGYGFSSNDTYSTSISIPWQYSDFRNRAQFTSIILFLPGYGMTELNADDWIGKSAIDIDINYCGENGDLTYKIGNVAICNCNIASNMGINLGGVSPSSGNIANNIGAVGSLVGNIASGDAIGTVTSAFNVCLASQARSVGSVGATGSSSSFNISRSIHCYVLTHNTNSSPSSMATNYGRPCNKVLSLGDCSGYVQCANASVSTVNSSFSDEINSLLNGGVYIE